MGYVDRFIKKINLEKDRYKEKGTLLPNLKEGDIIWAKRYSKEDIRQNIDLEHQESPFIVIYKDEKNTSFCLECSSKEDTIYSNIIELSKIKYKGILFKDTYVKLKPDVEMTSYRYLRKIGRLANDDFNLLKKTLFLLMTDEETSKLFSFSKNDLHYYIDSGDLIRRGGNTYLVGYREEDTLFAYRVIKNEVYYDITIDNIPYKIRYDIKKRIDALEKYTLLGIYHKFKAYYTSKKNRGYNIAEIGDLIKINNELYLVHGKYREYLVVIRIYQNIKGIKINTYSISIDNTIYKTGYEFYLLNSGNEYNIISNILEFEICEYTEKLKRLHITPKLSKEKILDIYSTSNINLTKTQKEILSQLKEMGFGFEDIVGIMVGLKEEKKQLSFNNYLIKNYNQKDKEIVKNSASYIAKTGEYNDNLFLKEGDIIIAKRENDPLFINNKTSIGPYIIIYVDKDQNKIYGITGLYSFSGKGKTIFKVQPKDTEMLEDDIIHIKGTTPIEITRKDYIKKIDELSKEDLNTLEKKVFSAMYFNSDNLPFNKENLKYYNSLYDVVDYNNSYYLIFDEDSNFFYSYQICKTNKLAYFKINKEGYMVNLRNITKLPKSNTYEVVRIIDKKTFDIIKAKKRWQNIDLPKVRKRQPQRGDIFEYNNKLYAIYGEYKSYFLLYLLFSDKKQDYIYSFTTENREYNTNFDICLVSKSTYINIIDNINVDMLTNQKRQLNINSTTYKKPIDYIDENTIILSNEQLLLIKKLKEYKFTEEEIIGSLVALNYKFVLDEILDFITKSEQEYTLTKKRIIKKIIKLIRA